MNNQMLHNPKYIFQGEIGLLTSDRDLAVSAETLGCKVKYFEV